MTGVTTLLLPLPVDDRYRHLMVPGGPHRELVDVPVHGFANHIGDDLTLHLRWNDKTVGIPMSRDGNQLTACAEHADKERLWASSLHERIRVCLWTGIIRLLDDAGGHDLLLAAIGEWDQSQAAAHPGGRPASQRRAAALAAAIQAGLPEHMYDAIMNAANDWHGSAADLVAAFTAATDHQR